MAFKHYAWIVILLAAYTHGSSENPRLESAYAHTVENAAIERGFYGGFFGACTAMIVGHMLHIGWYIDQDKLHILKGTMWEKSEAPSLHHSELILPFISRAIAMAATYATTYAVTYATRKAIDRYRQVNEFDPKYMHNT